MRTVGGLVYKLRFDYRLEHDPRFLRRIERARQSLRAGRGVKLEDVEA